MFTKKKKRDINVNVQSGKLRVYYVQKTRAFINKWPLFHPTPIGNASSAGGSERIKTVSMSRAAHVCVCVCVCDAYVLLHNANHSCSEASKSKMRG